MKRLVAAGQAALLQSLAAAGLAAYDGPLVVGVSGGSDSLALLDILARFYPAERLIVAHLDHTLRATSADDTALVARAAAERGLRFVAERADVAELARDGRQSLEAAGREYVIRFKMPLAGETVLPDVIRGDITFDNKQLNEGKGP